MKPMFNGAGILWSQDFSFILHKKALYKVIQMVIYLVIFF